MTQSTTDILTQTVAALIKAAPSPAAIYYVCRPMLFEFTEFSVLPNITRSTNKVEVMSGITELTDELLDIYINSVANPLSEGDGVLDAACNIPRPLRLEEAIQAAGLYHYGDKARKFRFPLLQELTAETATMFGMTWQEFCAAPWADTVNAFNNANEERRNSPYWQIAARPLRLTTGFTEVLPPVVSQHNKLDLKHKYSKEGQEYLDPRDFLKESAPHNPKGFDPNWRTG